MLAGKFLNLLKEKVYNQSMRTSQIKLNEIFLVQLYLHLTKFEIFFQLKLYLVLT
jgi:hypothetical protein